MGKGKKSFIDRNNAVTFHLVHRSQRDPLVTDETAPQHVLVESVTKEQNDSLDKTNRLLEQKKYGIHFDDDYDYLQHLKKPEQDIAWEYVENPNQMHKRIENKKNVNAPKLSFPSSVFPSEFEEDEGMLNKAALCSGPRVDWDPDVVAALDNDFDFDNEENLLEDDFIQKAMECTSSDDERDSNDLIVSDDEEDDSESSDKLEPLKRFSTEETKSRFTEYSMSSSVMQRNEQLSLLDERFEKFYSSYDDPEVGDLPLENIEGTLHQKHPYVLSCLKEFKKSKRLDAYNKDWDRERIPKYTNIIDGDSDPNEEMVEMEVNKKKKWDCESILSTYSTIYNHPKLIEETKKTKRHPQKINKIEVDPQTGNPINILNIRDKYLTTKTLAKLNDNIPQDKVQKSICAKSIISNLSVLSIRPPDESTEEKRERKRLLKEYRSERRIEKKANSEAFKIEKKRQAHTKINQRNNVQGVTIL